MELLKEPSFEEIQDGFRVTFFKATQKATQKTTQKTFTKDKIIDILQENPNLTRSEMAPRHLAALKSENRVERKRRSSMHNFKYVVYREDKYFVSQCLNVDVSSFGRSIDEAVTNLKDAVDLYLKDGIGSGMYHEVGDALIGEAVANA